ncbi:MAG: hypothetical protein ACYS8X_05340 [Planctomycetota bacterium]|jgi:hypothetical protein
MKGQTMNSSRKAQWAIVGVILVGLVVGIGAQDPDEDTQFKDPWDETVIRVYSVQEFLEFRAHFPYCARGWMTSEICPPASSSEDWPDCMCMIEEADRGEERPSLLPVEQIIELITSFIDPESWDAGWAAIAEAGTQLIVRQRPEAHEQIEALLTQLREKMLLAPGVSVEAKWVLLSSEVFARLSEDTAASPVVLTDDMLNEADEHTQYAGQITCRDAQLVHLVSGKESVLVPSVEPLVAEQRAAYRPVPMFFIWGAMLEVRPRLHAAQGQATLDINSFVTELTELRQKPFMNAPRTAGNRTDTTVIDLDEPEFLLHKLSTSLRVPLGKHILIGAMTAPEQKGKNGKVLCLILKVTAEEAE